MIFRHDVHEQFHVQDHVQAVPNSGSPVQEWIAEGVEREWWSAARFCMFQRVEWVSMLYEASKEG
jgi:hypothetical protein